MRKVQTQVHTVPHWKGDLLISLFMGDGGGGFSDEEIEEANQFIKDNHLLALVEVTEPIDDEIKCTFITKY